MNFSERPCAQDNPIRTQALSASQVTSVSLASLGEFSSPTAINLKGFSPLKQHKINSIPQSPRPWLSLIKRWNLFHILLLLCCPVTTTAIELKVIDIFGVLKLSIRKLCQSSPLYSRNACQRVRMHCSGEAELVIDHRKECGHLAALRYYNHFISHKKNEYQSSLRNASIGVNFRKKRGCT